MRKYHFFYLLFFFLLLTVNKTKAQLLYSDITDIPGTFASAGANQILMDDIQIDSATFGSYDTLNITEITTAISVAEFTPSCTLSAYYSLVSDTSTSAATAPSVPVYLGSVPTIGTQMGTGFEIDNWGETPVTFKVPKRIGKPYPGYQTFFFGLSFSRGGGIGWTNVTPTEKNADSVWLFDAKKNLVRVYDFPRKYASFYIQVYGYFTHALPVKFLDFEGVLKNNVATLYWKTASEINNKGFDVQRSNDDKNYFDIGFVTGKGTTQQISEYTYNDLKPLSGNNYYRLKQTDLDGNISYSSVVKINFENLDWKIFGNPSALNSLVQLQLDKPHTVIIQLVSATGKILQTIDKGNLEQGSYIVPINLQDEPAGLYFIRMIVDGNISSKSILK